MNIEEQIKEILDRHHVDAWGKAEIIKELSNLLTQQREEAVKSYIRYSLDFEDYLDTNLESIEEETNQRCRSYLSQQSLDGGDIQ